MNSLLSRVHTLIHGTAHAAFRWRRRGNAGLLEPLRRFRALTLGDLKCIDRQKSLLVRNTQQFIKKLPANNALLWGPRGTGKSSLIKAVFNMYSESGLSLVEVPRDLVGDLPDVCDAVAARKGRFIIYCDDLSFEANDPSYKAMKAVLDGSASGTPENAIIYATSNRRHLMPESMQENRASRVIDGELHLHEGIEEKLSLSERFGLWLSFHPFNQDQYLAIVDHWLERLGASDGGGGEVTRAALQWALERGSRSGRSAWQFACDRAGAQRLEQS